jgi:hypothetical protein
VSSRSTRSSSSARRRWRWAQPTRSLRWKRRWRPSWK